MKWCGKRNSESIRRPIAEQQAELLRHIGDKLRQKRLEQSLSLEKAAAKTLIRQHLLVAIEKGLLEELPEPVYIQKFIRQYAEVLGLDAEQLANSFPTDKHDRPANNNQPAWSLILPVVQLRPIHLYVLYIVAIALAVSMLSRSLSRNQLQTNSPLPELPIVANSPKPVAPTDSNKVESVSATPKINNQIQIGVTLKASSWIRVVADGKIAFQGLLPSGTQRTWVAKDNLTVLAGNAGGVLLTINQKESKQMGNLGEVQELTFAAPRL
ncbi:helix-turn-helix domain-containing protein [Synechocystis sp. PCC 7509]|uniref:helix-turn-helix domain-containing protein n=1 Tax=Synechocystis sp. PCC 7509 TaxID=927677 RepID=UPI0002ABABB1|nr:RodZ domain-containing protein [Synechocystis sp. PCC 7509]